MAIDLFAGCGGLSLGLHRAGWEGLFAIERDPMAFKTLNDNLVAPGATHRHYSSWPDWLPKQNLDLTKLLDDEHMRARLESLRGSVALVAGGPPCQGFSVGGRRDGADERNTMVFRMLEFVRLVQPMAVLVENVEGMGRRFVSRPGDRPMSVADAALDELVSMGYVGCIRVLKAEEYGVPQTRRRLVIIAVRTDVFRGRPAEQLIEASLDVGRLSLLKRYRLPNERSITAQEALADLCGSTRVPCPDSPGFEAATYGKATSRYAQMLRTGRPTGSVPDSHRFSKHGPGVHKLYELAHRTQPNGRLSKDFLLRNGTKKDKKVLIDPSRPVSTITTHPDEFIHYSEPRNISVREMARLQSFPDDFVFRGRYTINGPRRRFDVARCSQVGNAVPPLLAEGLGLALLELLRKLSSIDAASRRSPAANKSLSQFALSA